MSLYSSPIDRILPQLQGQNAQSFSGVDPDFVNLAQLYGYRPNPFPALGSQGQDEMRFLQTLKSIMDQQYAGYGGQLDKISPGNPTAAMPNSMYNYFSGAAPLFTSPAAQAVAPAGTAGFFSGGYKPGALPSNMSPLIQQYLSRIAPQNNPGAGDNSVAGAAAATNPSGTNVAQSVSGGNDTSNNPPNTVAYGGARPPADRITNSAAAPSNGPATLAAALQAQSRSSEQDNPAYQETIDALGRRVNATPNNDTGQGMNQREQALQALFSNIGQGASQFGSNIDQLMAGVLMGLMGGRR